MKKIPNDLMIKILSKQIKAYIDFIMNSSGGTQLSYIEAMGRKINRKTILQLTKL